MDLTVTSQAMEAMRRHARDAAPDEACGILYGSAGAIEKALRATNVHPDPRSRFEIDPQALIDAHRAQRRGGAGIAGYYHSHPDGPAEPSSTDRSQAAGDGAVWAIVAAGDVAFWRSDEDGFRKLSYRVIAA